MFRKLAGLTAVAGLFIMGTASAEITGSAHDFADAVFASGGATGEICVVCHAPHSNANMQTGAAVTGSDVEGLLWNHSDTGQTARDGYTVYTSPTMSVAGGQPGPVSYLCLGCHDGSVAVDSYGGNAGTTNIDDALFGRTAFGAALSDDHPIGLTYPTTAQDSEIVDKAATGGLYTLGNGDAADTIENDFLYGGLVECASCHDVHNTKSANNPSLLLVNNQNSEFCLVCHAK